MIQCHHWQLWFSIVGSRRRTNPDSVPVQLHTPASVARPNIASPTGPPVGAPSSPSFPYPDPLLFLLFPAGSVGELAWLLLPPPPPPPPLILLTPSTLLLLAVLADDDFPFRRNGGSRRKRSSADSVLYHFCPCLQAAAADWASSI